MNNDKFREKYGKIESRTDSLLQRLMAWPVTFLVVAVIVILALVGAVWLAW